MELNYFKCLFRPLSGAFLEKWKKNCPPPVACKWLLIAVDRWLACVGIGASESAVQVGSFPAEVQSALQWWFPGAEWGQPYWFCSHLWSIIRLLSRQPGSLRLSDFLFPSRLGNGEQTLHYNRVLSVCNDTHFHLFFPVHVHSCTQTHTYLWAGWGCCCIVDCRAELDNWLLYACSLVS